MYDIILGLIVALIIFSVPASVAAGENTKKAAVVVFFGITFTMAASIAIFLVMFNIAESLQLNVLLVLVMMITALVIPSIIFFTVIDKLIDRFGG